jgi:signal transduction histidine kinase
MEKILPLARQFSRTKWLPPLVTLLTLLILGGTIYLGTLQLRQNIRDQIIGRDAEVLDAVAVLDQLGADSPAELSRQLEDPVGQLALALRLSHLRQGVVATRLFDPSGELVVTMPDGVQPARLTQLQLARLRELVPISLYRPAALVQDYFLFGNVPGTNQFPVLSVLIPIHAEGQTNLLATAELIQDGTAIGRQLTTLDRHLARQALLAFAISGGIVSLALVWAFLRLQKLNSRLQNQAANLRRANQELALTAKTSALGAVTAHVIHGLTSPLNGLQNFVTAHAGNDEEWRDVLSNTRRMQDLVGEVVRVLGEQTDGTHYELTLPEIAEILSNRIKPAAASLGVLFQSHVSAHAVLSNRTANLLLLILENLVQNALQATPRGKLVTLSIACRPGGLICEIMDEGAGLPVPLRQNLFVPCRSTKPSGNGIGLALSQHLARHLGAELKMVRSSDAGSLFALFLPQDVLDQEFNAEPHPISE